VSGAERKVAREVRRLDGFAGDARLFELVPRMSDANGAKHRHVVVSAAVAAFSGPETYIFPADASGKVSDWGELEGSYRGGLDHAEALFGAGYEVAECDVEGSGAVSAPGAGRRRWNPEPWDAPGNGSIVDANGSYVCSVPLGPWWGASARRDAIAERIVECVNAAPGLAAEVAALRDFALYMRGVNQARVDGGLPPWHWAERCEAALARGEAAP
jgi:hypothetical protein